MVQNRGKEIHTKAVADVSRGGASFGSCSTWEGANDCGKRLPGETMGQEETTQINYEMCIINDSF